MSDRGQVLLQALREKLSNGWAHSIQRATGATSVRFRVVDPDEFVAIVIWRTLGGPDRVYEKRFTKPYILGASFHRPMLEWGMEKRACDHARDIMREVLAQRGAL
jgi:hypothetical protein